MRGPVSIRVSAAIVSDVGIEGRPSSWRSRRSAFVVPLAAEAELLLAGIAGTCTLPRFGGKSGV